MSSAQLDVLPVEDILAGEETLSARELAAARLQAHRQRRARQNAQATAAVLLETNRTSGKNKIAAAVAERYAQTPSFRARLAEEAQRSMEAAAAAAEVALRNAEAVQQAQAALLAELERYVEPVEFSVETAAVVVPRDGGPAEAHVSEARHGAPPVFTSATSATSAPKPVPVREVSAAGLTVRLYEDVGPMTRAVPRGKREIAALSEEEARALDEEIAFRKAPVFEEALPDEPAVLLPANLLEFPRQLIAPKKARPVRAEGPLLEEAAARSPQMRIFEVGPELPPVMQEQEPASHGPEWGSIWLDAHTVTEPEPRADEHTHVLPSLLPPQVAAMHLRVMAAMMDGALVAGGFVLFSAAAARMAGPMALTVPLILGAAVVLAGFYFIYQALFFTLTDQTPGMRYARIGLCTFSDENPSRTAMRKRALAKLVSMVPLGLGLVWALLDDDKLTWHDRMSRIYQRSY